MANPEDETVLPVAALGRSFHLGMCYDRRTEMQVPDVTLCDKATLEGRAVDQRKDSDFQVFRGDSVEKKASALEMDRSLRLSFLAGFVDVQGAAKYLLHNEGSSSHEQCITLHCKCTTREESIAIEKLGKVQPPKDFDHGTGTHVVTSIVYGAQAFFVFKRRHSTSDAVLNEESDVHALIEKIPRIEINEKGELDMSKTEKAKAEALSCILIGDFPASQNPLSFLDAVKLYKKIPEFLGTGGGNAVPVKVTLTPLTLIDGKATRLVREIGDNLAMEIESFFQGMHEVDIKCEDIRNTNAIKTFKAFQSQMEKFVKIKELWKMVIQKELCKMLPMIRSGKMEEQCLVELIAKIKQSPVNVPALRSWLQLKNIQAKVLNKYVSAMAGMKFASEVDDVQSVVTGSENTYVLCLTISLPSCARQLDTMKQYCLGEQSPSGWETADHTVSSQQTDDRAMIAVARKFRDFYNANNTKKGISFIVAQEFSKSETFHARVQFYKNGGLMSNNYELPSALEKVNALVEDTTHNSVTISWTPKYGASDITSYVVSCFKSLTEHVTSRVEVDRDGNKTTIRGLAANTNYKVRVWGTCEAGTGPYGDVREIVKTKPASQPEIVLAVKISPTQVFLKWQPPACVADGCSVKKYVIKQEMGTGQWEEICHIPSTELSYKMKIKSKAVPSFRVAASCGSDGLSCDSDPWTVDVEKPTTCESLKQYICATSVLDPNNSKIYKLELNRISSNYMDMIDKYDFGERKFGSVEKVIMLVGATGSGKTTLINGFVNYIFGVQWTDTYRFKMISEPNAANQAKSQTTKITSYTLHHQEGFTVPYTLTIIDTPGFGDVSGIMRDKEITENIRKFFTTTTGANGISHIDVVGFVANSSQPRLTPKQKYIFDQILSLYGKDIADNIFLLLTFADGKKPQVLSGIKEAKIPYKKHFKFNNSALYALHDDECSNRKSDSDEEDGDSDSMFWDMGVKSFFVFLEQLGLVESKSLILTQNVLNERSRLQTSIVGIQTDIREGLSTLERLRKEMEVLENHQAEIERNKNFEYEVDEEVTVTVPIPRGEYITNCLKCNRTCHLKCKIAEDENKNKCAAMNEEGNCRICPDNYIWNVHRNMPYKYELRLKKTKKTFSDLRQRYEEATEKKLSTENLIEKINEEFEAVKLRVIAMTDSVRKSIQRLEEIALRPSPMTTVQYLEVLMETEKSQALPGWQARLKQLSKVKEEAECMEKVAGQGFEPFKRKSSTRHRSRRVES